MPTWTHFPFINFRVGLVFFGFNGVSLQAYRLRDSYAFTGCYRKSDKRLQKIWRSRGGGAEWANGRGAQPVFLDSSSRCMVRPRLSSTEPSEFHLVAFRIRSRLGGADAVDRVEASPEAHSRS